MIAFYSYEVMTVCWEVRPEDRPTFADCVAMIEALLKNEDPIEELKKRRSKPPPVPSQPPPSDPNTGNVLTIIS